MQSTADSDGSLSALTVLDCIKAVLHNDIKVTGGGGVDSIAGGAGADTIQSGAGANAIFKGNGGVDRQLTSMLKGGNTLHQISGSIQELAHLVDGTVTSALGTGGRNRINCDAYVMPLWILC